jgi:hypothetical protein
MECTGGRTIATGGPDGQTQMRTGLPGPVGAKHLAVKRHPNVCQALAAKIFHFTEIRICRTSETPRPDEEGRIAIVTNRGLGCDGRDGVGRE